MNRFFRRIFKKRRRMKNPKPSKFCWEKNPKGCKYCSCGPATPAQDNKASNASDDDARESEKKGVHDDNTSLSLGDSKSRRNFKPVGKEKKHVTKTKWLKLGSDLLDFVTDKSRIKKKKPRTEDGDKKQMTLKLTGVTIFPEVDDQDEDAIAGTGTLEAHVDRFIYTTSSSYFDTKFTFEYENVKEAFVQVEDDQMKTLPLLHLQLHHPIKLGTKETEHIQFHLMPTVEGSDNDLEKSKKDKEHRDSSRIKDLHDFVEKVRKFEKEKEHKDSSK